MEPRRTMPFGHAADRRSVRLAIVVALGVAIGVGAYLAFGFVTMPRPHDAAGWSLLADMPIARGETAVAVAGDKLHVIGGLAGPTFQASAEVSIYDAATATWASGPRLPEPRHHAAAATLGGDIYVTGGGASMADGTPRTDGWVLRAESGEWRPIAPMPVGRLGHRMVAMQGHLYVVGGVPGTGDLHPAAIEVLVYDPAADSWQFGGSIPQTRDHLAVVAVHGEIWAIGGRSNGRNLARVDIYDPVTQVWRDGPPLPEPTSGAAEGAMDGVIVVSGGEDPATGQIVDRHWMLNTAMYSGTWQPLPSPPLTVHGAPGAELDGQFVIAGGAARAGGQSSTAWSGLVQVFTDPPWAAPGSS